MRAQNRTLTSRLGWTWMVSMKRMRCGLVCITTELVRMPSPKNRTPFISVAVGDAGGREDDVLARRQVVGRVDLA